MNIYTQMAQVPATIQEAATHLFLTTHDGPRVYIVLQSADGSRLAEVGPYADRLAAHADLELHPRQPTPGHVAGASL